MDVLLFGRVTYELMAAYWPTPLAIKNDPIIAGKMNAKTKMVFSRTLEKVEWNNTRLVKKNMTEDITQLKGQPGRDLIIFGSANLAARLAKLDLIDEYQVMVNPVILGNGRRLFEGFQKEVGLELLRTRTFRNGNVLLCYQPHGK